MDTRLPVQTLGVTLMATEAGIVDFLGGEVLCAQGIHAANAFAAARFDVGRSIAMADDTASRIHRGAGIGFCSVL